MKKRKAPSDDELLRQALQQLLSAEKHMEPIMRRVRRARLVALGRTNSDYGKTRDPADPSDWRSRIFPPIANEQWELLNSEMTVDDPRFKWTPRDVRFAENAIIAEKALDYFFDRDRFSRKFRLAMRATARDGGQVIKTVWAEDKCPKFDDAGRVVPGEYEVVHAGTCNVLCRLEDVFPDPTATDFDDCGFVFHRSFATLADLEARTDNKGEPFYKNLHLLLDSGAAEAKDEQRPNETTEAFTARRTGVHTLHERWTRHGRLTIANRSVIIRRDDRLPFKHGKVPFTMIRIIDDEDCIVGVSPMTLIDEIQECFWDLLNSLIDAVKLAVRPPMLVDIEEDAKSAEYDIRPDAKIPARNAASTVKVLQDVAQLDKYNPMMLMDKMRELMERITGMNSSIAGASQASTATQAAIDVRQAKGRSGSMMSVSDECWSQVAEKAYSTIQQYASDEVMALLSDGREVRFTPEQLTDMFISPKAASSERNLKDLERQDSQSAWEAVSAALYDPATQLPQIDPTAALTRLLEAFGVDPREVIVGPPSGPVQAMPDPMAAGGMPTVLDEDGNPLPVDQGGQLMPDALDPSYDQQPGSPPRPEQYIGG